MIIQIFEYLGFGSYLSDVSPVASKTKIDMESLIHQGMVIVYDNTYSVMIRHEFILELPDPSRVSVVDKNNWLYKGPDHLQDLSNEEDKQNVDNFVARNTTDEDDTFQQ